MDEKDTRGPYLRFIEDHPFVAFALVLGIIFIIGSVVDDNNPLQNPAYPSQETMDESPAR